MSETVGAEGRAEGARGCRNWLAHECTHVNSQTACHAACRKLPSALRSALARNLDIPSRIRSAANVRQLRANLRCPLRKSDILSGECLTWSDTVPSAQAQRSDVSAGHVVVLPVFLSTCEGLVDNRISAQTDPS